MSTLVILVPARARLQSRSAAEPGERAERGAAEFSYVLSGDGRSVLSAGRSAPALLPRADSLVAVLADSDVAWQRVTLPRAPAARLRAALAGVMEEALLDEDDAVHLALAPQASAGQPAWVAVVHKPWLTSTLAALEAGGRIVERVLPASAPGESGGAGAVPRGHFFNDASDGGASAAPLLALTLPEGAACLRTSGTLARALLPAAGTPLSFTATPAAAAAAERWLGAPVAVLGESERALQALASGWNLRQFELAPRNRGALVLRDAWRRLFSPAWRPVRLGLATLAVVQLLGLNLWAWHQQRVMADKRAAMTALLRTSHPGVRAIIDPPLQMRRATETLRSAAGRPGDADLEVLLAAAAAAWPEGQGPVQTLRFEAGQLTLAASGWGEAQLAQFRKRLQGAGFKIDSADGNITLSRGARGAA